MNEPVEMISIPKSEYDRLLKDADWLACLEACGVDNWSGYDDAREMHRTPPSDAG